MSPPRTPPDRPAKPSSQIAIEGVAQHNINVTIGHLLRHAPAQSSQGRQAAIIDVGQDLLLRYLSEIGVLDLVAFKGGTALRKVYAGASGRFSTDLDFSIASLDDAVPDVIELLTDTIRDAQIGPYRFDITTRRNRPSIVFTYSGTQEGRTGPLVSKLDVGPPPWLDTDQRKWVDVPIHRQYGGPLPSLPVVNLAENVAEKIARLNRRSLARDAYDLVWISSTANLPELDRTLLRRLVVLKCWVDTNGLDTPNATWARLPNARPFDVARWLAPRARSDFEDENIGLLTTPPPDLDDLGAEMSDRYRWLADGLDADDLAIGRCDPADRGLVLRALAELPGARLAGLIR